jgi:hypothetical protein
MKSFRKEMIGFLHEKKIRIKTLLDISKNSFILQNSRTQQENNTMKKLLILILSTLSLTSFAETYHLKKTISPTIENSVFNSPAPTLDPEAWVTFFNTNCGTNFTNTDDMINSTGNIACGSKGLTHSDFPVKSGFSTFNASINLNNNSISNLDFFSELTRMENNLNLAAAGLNNIDGLSKLTYIGGNLGLYYNSLAHIDGLSNVIEIAGEAYISAGYLPNINGLSSLESVGKKWGAPYGSLLIINAGLTDITPLSNLKIVYGKLQLTGNPNITDLSPLNGITHVGELVRLDAKVYDVKLSATSYLCTANKVLQNMVKSDYCEI